jgi:hypothetical protein
MTDKIPVCHSSAERVFEHRHWSPALDIPNWIPVSALHKAISAFNCAAHWKDGKGSTPNPSLQCEASLRAKTLEPRTLSALYVRDWIPVSSLDRTITEFNCATHWNDGQNPRLSLQCGASLRAETLEPRTLSSREIQDWIPVSPLQKAPHWKDGQGDYSQSVSPVRSESSSADTGAQDLVITLSYRP